jgi:SAM-dependent methyltransferase
MRVVRRGMGLVSSFLLSYGPQVIKRRVWDKRFSTGQWNFIDHTVGDCVYPVLERYARSGSILDLGCGPGNTANELAADVYHSYVGVDISEEALAKAAARTEASARKEKNRFVCGDFLAYVPTEQFDIILFRESMYHVPLGRVKTTLDRYSPCLKEGGVFIVRLFAASRENDKSKSRPTAMLGILESEFNVVEKLQSAEPGRPTVVVLRPKSAAAKDLKPDGLGSREAPPALSHR